MIRVYGLKRVPRVVRGLVRDLRLRWALEEAGLAYEEQLVGFEELATPDYRALQPFGQVPVYEEDGVTLFESGAIVLHIAAKSEALLPRDPTERAQVISWMFAALNSIEPPIQQIGIMDAFGKGEDWDRMRPHFIQQAEQRLDSLAAALNGRDFLTGQFSAADLLMTSVLRILRHTDLVEHRPVLDEYRKRCESRPAFQRALEAQLAAYERNMPARA